MSSNKGEITIVEPSRAERSIARRAAESRATIPHLELSLDVQIDDAAGLLPRLVRASALGLRGVPRANASYRDGRFELYSRVNVGILIPTNDGYTIPTVFDADTKSLDQLGEEIADLQARALIDQLTPPELSGATFTVSQAGGDRGWPLIVAPHAAALAAGEPRQAPVVRDGSVVPGTLLTVALACDHRVLYGRHAAQLLAAIASRLVEANP
jgi:pyruvate dehydrogenase E2 component (dihydrolipoamide acetyltransferase)